MVGGNGFPLDDEDEDEDEDELEVEGDVGGGVVVGRGVVGGG